MVTAASLTSLNSMAFLALAVPSMELILIMVFGAILPMAFFIWMSWWLGSVRDTDPDQEIAEQKKMDAAHHGHPAATGHGHGHGH